MDSVIRKATTEGETLASDLSQFKAAVQSSRSGIYVGTVRHRRFTPVTHSFEYPLFMPFIDLDEIEALASKVKGFGFSKWHPARFLVTDYLNGQASNLAELKQGAQDKITELTGEVITGKVFLLCQLRYFGLYFSPLNLYYLFDEQGEWQYMLAEVSNTPWNERHYYAIPAVSRWESRLWQAPKAFHVSPFNPMEQEYRWQIKQPIDQLRVHLEVHGEDPACDRSETVDSGTEFDAEKENEKQNQTDKDKVSEAEKAITKVFDASMMMKLEPFSSSSLRKQMMVTPIMTVKVVIGIYWQALKLWIKGVRFHDHPESAASELKK
ncbi:DUF1365 domain-containing protein [Photobacterium swingsii]|uniref:DUF1365 domain-containing protein n=1 Tax=Photobacterium swingsii TaxID=680026 RepID=UPI003D0A32AA